MIKKYKKRPVVIEAVKFEYKDECLKFLKEWLGEEMGSYGKDRRPEAKAWLQVGTLEDGQDSYQVKHIATEGDYIVKGIQGEFYPVKPEIFEDTYQEVNTPVKQSEFIPDDGC